VVWEGECREAFPYADSGVIGYFQYAHTAADSVMVNDYMGAGFNGVGLVPGRSYDTINLGMAWSSLNDVPGQAAFSTTM